MSLLQLSRHIVVEPNDSGGLRLSNLYYDCHLDLTPAELGRLDQLGQSPRRELAKERHILVEAGEVTPRCPFISDLEKAVRDYIAGSLGYYPPTIEESLALLQEALEAYLKAVGRRKREAAVMFAPLRHLLEREPGRPQGGLRPELLCLGWGRPGVRPELEELPCTMHTAQLRAQLALSLGRRIAILGDDDLVSLALFPSSAEVLEIDRSLVSFLRQRGVSVTEHDLSRPLPKDYTGRFDVVLTDPPYAGRGFASFLERAHEALEPGGNLLLSTNLDQLEARRDWQEWGFTLESHQVAFNSYPHPQDLRDANVETAALFDFPPWLGRIVFGPPFFYSDLFRLRKL